MDIQAIKAEIADPAYLGLTPTEIADKLNAKVIPVQGPISVEQLYLWAVKVQAPRRFRALVDANVEPLATIGEIALRWLDMGLALDPTLPEVQTMLGQLQGESGFTAAEATDLLARGQRLVSRAEQLGLGPVFAQDVIDAQHA